MCGCGGRVCCDCEDFKDCLILLAVVAALVVVAGVVIVAVIFGGPLRHMWITVAGVSLTRFALVSTPPAMTALAVHNPLAIGIKHN